MEVNSTLTALLADIICKHLGNPSEFCITTIPQRYTGQPYIFVLQPRHGPPEVAIQISDIAAPDMAIRSGGRLSSIRKVAGASAAQHILEPVAGGWESGVSYVIYPYCKDLRKRGVGRLIEWEILRSPLLNWLFGLATNTLNNDISLFDRNTLYLETLEFLYNDSRIEPELKSRARDALASLPTGRWGWSTVMMHGDLWMGNVMVLAPSGAYKIRTLPRNFQIIDWPGCLEQGYPFFDLFRLARSLQVSKRTLRNEVMRYTTLLSCQQDEVAHYVTAALGHILKNLENFPIDQFNKMSQGCCSQLKDLGL